ncbi:hypothetical protein EDB81DRAFT_830685 [Dactylonectria macrodidyma]|uniref:H/ACA ribonucleoprotein complex subunit NOP10 n=1 Tax=Dactylonectria macrodidyma TaxID=307937 RepID=A0A9P9I8U7_9HYPO|nr:hypothetical protein EDB81DRAFT_830685 [Dactylonectria macrodidyma]
MHRMYIEGEDGDRVYSLKKILNGKVTKSAQPARFSSDDKYSRQRVTLKRRFGLLTQQSACPCAPLTLRELGLVQPACPRPTQLFLGRRARRPRVCPTLPSSQAFD